MSVQGSSRPGAATKARTSQDEAATEGNFPSLDDLLRQARALVRATETPEPAFSCPIEPGLAPEQDWEVFEGEHGRGVRAKRALAAGTLLAIKAPLAMVMDWEVDDFDAGAEALLDADDPLEMNAANEDSAGTQPVAKRARRNAARDESGREEREGDAADLEEADLTTIGGARGDDNAVAAHEIDDAASVEDVTENQAVVTQIADGDTDAGPDGSIEVGLLALRLAKRLKATPQHWQSLGVNELFPRTADEAAELPLWMCRNATIGMDLERRLDDLRASGIADAGLLPLKVRYNCMHVATSPELLSYPERTDGCLADLSATALYGPRPASSFNHSNTPNVSRFSVGNISVWRTNRPVSAAAELCISYVEHEILCEDASTVDAWLDMDFATTAACQEDAPMHADEDPVTGPVLDVARQNEIMSVHPPETRLAMMANLESKMAAFFAFDGAKFPADPGREEHQRWYKCDLFQLSLMAAVTLDLLSRHEEASARWDTCLAFCRRFLPPHDEATVMVLVRASLSHYAASVHHGPAGDGDAFKEQAQRYENEALAMHKALFGGGRKRFLLRYANDMNLGRKASQKAAGSSSEGGSSTPFEWDEA